MRLAAFAAPFGTMQAQPDANAALRQRPQTTVAHRLAIVYKPAMSTPRQIGYARVSTDQQGTDPQLHTRPKQEQEFAAGGG